MEDMKDRSLESLAWLKGSWNGGGPVVESLFTWVAFSNIQKVCLPTKAWTLEFCDRGGGDDL